MNMLLILTFLAFSETPVTIDQPEVWKVAPHDGRRGRILFSADSVLLNLAENPNYVPNWEDEATADEEGMIAHRYFRNGWAYGEYKSDRDQTVLLEGSGFHSLFVNGERFIGDYYSRGLLRVPVPLKQGKNRFFVRAARSRKFKIQLIPAAGSCSISPHDVLLPDIREGGLLDSFGAVVILNQTSQRLSGAELEAGDDQVFEKVSQKIDPLIPFGITKPSFYLKQLRQPEADELDEKGVYKLPVTLRHGETVQTVQLPMPVRKSGQPYKVTKLSDIDGSVQYYAVRPPVDFDPEKSYALYLTLHGAAVEATGQVGAYSSKADGFIVAPTNRRPYGFDWQEWGRLDALETMRIFIENYPIDPQRVYLTGHSMGGHGAWYLAALYPSKFAATGPSAGWISFSSYTRSLLSEIEADLSPFEWAQMESDTMALVENYTDLPVYALHGEKDNNVPVRESRRMVAELEKFHENFVYHEQPGAGHWWDDSPDPGAACVDWKPMFEFFRKHTIPEHPLSIKFKTPNPAISSEYAWIKIQSQIRPPEFSSVEAEADPDGGKITISTDNIKDLRLMLEGLISQNEAEVKIDETAISVSTEKTANLTRTEEDGWTLIDEPSPCMKGAHRNGPFKLAFDRWMVWVYGTSGTDEENAAILAKVRYDAQMWWYRGNGSVTIVPDSEFDPELYAGRNIILFGNADTNSAFDRLLKGCPISVNRYEIRIGDELYRGNLTVFFTYPHPKSGENLIGVIGTTSPEAVRMNFQARYFISGVACPDYVLFGRETLTKGMAGVMKAGYFDNKWKLRPER